MINMNEINRTVGDTYDEVVTIYRDTEKNVPYDLTGVAVIKLGAAIERGVPTGSLPLLELDGAVTDGPAGEVTFSYSETEGNALPYRKEGYWAEVSFLAAGKQVTTQKFKYYVADQIVRLTP